MNRPRHRRKDPLRTGPIRNAGEAWRTREPPDAPREPEDDDPASNGVRVGSRVIDEQIRRGRRTAQRLHREPREEPRYRHDHEPRSAFGGRGGRGGCGPFGMPAHHLERLCREILRQLVSVPPNPWKLAELLLQFQIEAISGLARLGFGVFGMGAPSWTDSYDEDVDRVTRDFDEGYEYDEEVDEEDDEEPWPGEPRDWPAAPSTPSTVRSTVPIPVYVSSYERTEVDLDLPAGSQSLELVIEPPRVTGVEPAPPAFEAEWVEVADAPAILRIEVPRELPAGRYRRRILIRATGEPVGDLTVQVGDIPASTATPPARKARKSR